MSRDPSTHTFDLMKEQDALVSKAVRLGDRRLEWNEIDYIAWPEFRRMAPAIVGLEIGRLESLMVGADVGTEHYNALVRTRYALRNFVEGIETSEKESVSSRTRYLEQALLGLSTAAENSRDHDRKTIRYVAHRLTYVHERLKLIY